MDFCRFYWSSWEPRTSEEHIHHAGSSKRAKKRQTEIEHKHGARWLELFHLSSYVALRFIVIDPIYNFLLDTATHVFRLWTEVEILTTKSLDDPQAWVENIKVPCEGGRIPLQISSTFIGFTADQWKNSTITRCFV